MKTFQEVIQIQKKVEDDILKIRGVTGIDVTYRPVKGQGTDEYIIQIFVEDRAEALARLHLPDAIQGVPVEVVERRFDLA